MDVAYFTLEKLEDVWGLGLASTVALSQATMQTNLLPDTSTMAVIVFQIWKFEPSVPFLVGTIAAKDMKCTSFPNLAVSTLLALMNVLVTFNAHLSLSNTLPFHGPLFLFFTPFRPVSHCLVLYYAIWFTFLCLHFVLMKSIWLAFILSRDVFVLTRITTNSRRRVFAWNVDFCFSKQLQAFVKLEYINIKFPLPCFRSGDRQSHLKTLKRVLLLR